MGRTHQNARRELKAWAVAAALAAGLGSAGAATADILTFDTAATCLGGPCTDSALILQSYGDTAFVDVQFDGDVTNSGFETMRHWGGGYSDLSGVAYFGLAFASPNPAGVRLIPVSGYEITLNSFDLGSFGGARNTQVTLRGGGGSFISSTGTFLTNGAMRNSFAPGLTRADGFRIEFGPDDFNVGIDNINFTVSRIGGDPGVPGVPEPSAWALMILGFGAAGAMLRRRDRVVAV